MRDALPLRARKDARRDRGAAPRDAGKERDRLHNAHANAVLPAEGLRLLPFLGDVLRNEQQHRRHGKAAREDNNAVGPVGDVFDPAVE